MQFDKIQQCGIVPVVALKDTGKAVDLAKALKAGGIDVIEVTYRTPNASEVIELLRRDMPDLTVGAGTVINDEQLEQALDAGAEFVVSPGTDESVIKRCVDAGVAILPGVVTPTEIMVGMRYGLSVFKFFPAGIYGGLKTIKALRGPFGEIRFVPTGGISAANLVEYANEKSVLAVGGSWMVKSDLIDQGQFDRITELAKEATGIWKQVRA